MTHSPAAEAALKTGWIGVDLDSTLAFYDHWRGMDHVGAPIPAMLARVRKWLDEGREVRIVTARVAPPYNIPAATAPIQTWCIEHLGQLLPITCSKDLGMICLWDDRAVQIVSNTGARVDGATE